jgi:hypothetical protein
MSWGGQQSPANDRQKVLYPPHELPTLRPSQRGNEPKWRNSQTYRSSKRIAGLDWRPRQIKASAERINDRDTIDLTTVGHIFGIQPAAAERTSGGDDCSVPIGQTVLCLNLQRSGHD